MPRGGASPCGSVAQLAGMDLDSAAIKVVTPEEELKDLENLVNNLKGKRPPRMGFCSWRLAGETTGGKGKTAAVQAAADQAASCGQAAGGSGGGSTDGNGSRGKEQTPARSQAFSCGEHQSREGGRGLRSQRSSGAGGSTTVGGRGKRSGCSLRQHVADTWDVGLGKTVGQENDVFWRKGFGGP